MVKSLAVEAQVKRFSKIGQQLSKQGLYLSRILYHYYYYYYYFYYYYYYQYLIPNTLYLIPNT